MAFGKRRLESANAPSAPRRPEQTEPIASRQQRLQEQLARLLSVGREIAEAVRTVGSPQMPSASLDLDPTAGPFDLRGFHEHFIVREGRQTGHLMLAYGNPQLPDTVDPNAQLHLQELTGQAMAFNLYCQRAYSDGALGVALQSTEVPPAIDKLLVRAAFFAALLDNMVSYPGSSPASLRLHKANLDRHLLMAQDKMLEPGAAKQHLPVREWPLLAVEVPVAAHDGDQFINGVYFPAEHAQIIVSLAGQPAALADVA